MNKKTYLIEKAEKGLTIQQYLKQIAGFSNAQIRSMKFTENGICLGGQRARVTTRLSEGDVLEVLLETKNSSSAHLLSFEQMPDILYEDADVIAMNKPAGMAVHPSHGHYQDTLANQLAYYFRKNTQQVEIHSIGRLDLETSGIVLFARHRAAAARLSRQREDGRLQKTYLAICSGIFAEKNGTLNGAIAPLPGSLMKMCVSKDGKPAVTHYQVQKQYMEAALVRLTLETGRTHQIRVHMADAGHPLIGDRLYFADTDQKADVDAENCFTGIKRAALHASRICFYQPFEGKRITVEAPFPEDMKKCLFRDE